jgi:hypothetical protein
MVDWVSSNWGFLVLPAINIFGCITNLVNIAVLINPKMKDISFKYILVTCICDLLFLMLGTYTFNTLCADCPLYHTYLTQFDDLFIVRYINTSLTIFIILIDIIVSLIRYSVLKNKTSLLSFNFYLVAGVLFLISFLIYSPLLFFKEIKPIQRNNNTEYIQVKTPLGLSLFGTITSITVQSTRGILAMFVLTSINVLNSIEFRKRYSNRFKNPSTNMTESNIRCHLYNY